jgi:CHAT domain-containing protein/tetratricopeptide (TPR) repeat protein
MKFGLPWLRLSALVACLWAIPVDVWAVLFQPPFEKSVEKLDALEHKQGLENGARPWVKQSGESSQVNSDALFSIEGALTDDDAQLDDGSLHDVHIFEGEAGQIVRILLVSEEFDTFLWLQNASGEELTRNDNGGNGTNAEIVFRLPETGQYWILANAYDESGRGTYRLIVEQSDENSLRQTELSAEADRLQQQGIDSYQISYQSALEFLQSALEIYRDIDNRQGEANLLGNLGNVYYSRGDYLRAIDFHQQSLAIKREIGDQQGEANSLGNLGNAYNSLGEYPQAIGFHKQSLTIYRKIGDRQGEAGSFVNLGLAYNSLGYYLQAIDLYQQALAIARDIGARQVEANSLGNLGIAYNSLGDYPRAIDFLQQQLAIVHDIGDRRGRVVSLGNLGDVYNSLGDYPRAIDFLKQSLSIARDIGDRQGEAGSLGNLGIAYRSLGKYPQAIDFHQQSLAIYRDIGDRQGEADSLGNLGIAYLGIAYYSLEDYPRAIGFHQQSLAIYRDIGDRQGEANSLGNLGNVYYRLGNYPRAIDFNQQSLAITHDIGDRQGEASSLGNLGLSYFSQGNLAFAIERLFDAVSIYEGLRPSELPDSDRVRFFETQVKTYKILELALIDQNRYSEALKVSERGRTRSFVQLVSERLSERTETRVLADSQSLQSFSDMQKVAATQHSVLVEYSLVTTPDNISWLYVWVIQPTGKLDFRQVSLGDDPNRLPELVRQSRESIGVRGRGFVPAEPDTTETAARDKLRELHQLMIEPIEDLLPSDPEQKVVFIPQGDLFLVPFPALMDESGEYLIKQHTILTAPSIQVLDLTRQQAMANTDDASANLTPLLAVGNPVMPEVWNPEKGISAQLSPLMGAEQEANAVADFFNTEALLGAEATEQVVKQQMGNARIVHLATHGLLEYGTPEESGVRDVPGAIALTPTQTEDGLLTAAEILELDLKADLVVLSACDTGLGTITGDGVIGLSRSLIAAGTPSVIVSLWSIPDAPTADLMTEFYRQRQQGKDKAQALRQAMLTTMETHPNPGDWAAFTLIGEAD